MSAMNRVQSPSADMPWKAERNAVPNAG
jgi:hypothetical protein